jgi:hypothetical protein
MYSIKDKIKMMIPRSFKLRIDLLNLFTLLIFINSLFLLIWHDIQVY